MKSSCVKFGKMTKPIVKTDMPDLPLVLKRERNSVGDTAMARANARSMRRKDPNPQLNAMEYDLFVGLQQPAASQINAYSFDKIGRADIEACSKKPTERAQGYTGLKREHVGLPIIRRVLTNFLGEPPDLRVARRLGGKLRRELTLSPWANAEDDMASGDCQGQCAAVVGFDHGQREVHTSRNAGRRPHASVLDVDRIAVDLDLWSKAFKLIHSAPMRCRPAVIEHTSSRKKECATANGCDPGDASDSLRHNASDRTVLQLDAEPLIAACRSCGGREWHRSSSSSRGRTKADQAHPQGGLGAAWPETVQLGPRMPLAVLPFAPVG